MWDNNIVWMQKMQRGATNSRYLIVNFDNVPFYPSYTDGRVTGQVILYEGTNLVEIHVTTLENNQPQVITQGVESADGTAAYFLSGRVDSTLSLSNDAVRFATGTQ